MADRSPAPVADRAPAGRWLAAALLITPLLRWTVLVHSVPAGEPWRTSCPHCGTALAPLARATSPAARCASCGQRIGPPPLVVELATVTGAVLVVLAVAGGGWPVAGVVALAGWTAVAVALVFVDLAVHRLPDRLTLPAAGWVVVWLAVAAATTGRTGTEGAWVRAVAAAAACGLGFAVFSVLLGSRGYGLGDAKLALSAGALLGWLGWTAVVAGLLLAFLASGLVATGLLIARRVGWRDALPFGPYLVAGTLATLAWVGLS